MAAFKDHFSTIATQYAEFRPLYPRELFEYLASLAVARDLAWDCACGSGQATLPLATHFGRVLGTDASGAQIAAAAPHPRVEYRVAPAEQCGLANGCVDLITVAQALHWFEVERFYAEADRVLRTGGTLAVWTYGGMRMPDAALDEELLRFNRDVVGPHWPAERRLVDEGYRTLPFPYAELESPVFHMQQRWALTRLLGYVRSWSATRRFMAHYGTDPVVDLARKLQALWGDDMEERRIIWPLSLRVGLKEAAGQSPARAGAAPSV
ncbi:MAG TPA: class I SAM-dependent methyltransferase [Steroidobacteraceae bacterium]|nr:class I SAM-dependent methyltransferase [Steroidobacteraceae bacterium]